jgi:hypothetical protein
VAGQVGAACGAVGGEAEAVGVEEEWREREGVVSAGMGEDRFCGRFGGHFEKVFVEVINGWIIIMFFGYDVMFQYGVALIM